jgi:poly-gamma-glutamate capsule biosynthesis protein CapA/YwtB (metallophosphatase superfamily)
VACDPRRRFPERRTLEYAVPPPPFRPPVAVRRLVVAFLTLAALLLTACGGGGDPEPASQATQATRATTSTATTVRPTTTTAERAGDTREPTGEPVTIAFGGDVHFEGVIGSRLAADPSTTLGPIASMLRRADLAVVNLETAITERGTPAPKDFTFRAPPSALSALKAAGVDVATMANNHGEDFGVVGLRDSLAAAREADFPVVGIGRDADEAYRPHLVTVKGQRIAVIGATQVLDSNLAAAWTAGDGKAGMASAYQEERLLAAVRAARASADTVIVDLHWGRELANCPIDRQRALAPKLVAAGADVVVGSHAHILLGGGYLRGAYVHYGLGNFVFYSRGGVTAQSGVLLLTTRGRAVTAARWVPAVISGGIPIPLEGGAADRAFDSWQSLRRCTGLSAKP